MVNCDFGSGCNFKMVVTAHGKESESNCVQEHCPYNPIHLLSNVHNLDHSWYKVVWKYPLGDSRLR